MSRFRRILFIPVGSTRHLSADVASVVDFAGANGAEVTLFGVVPALSRLQAYRVALGEAQKSISDLASDRLKSILGDVAQLMPAGLKPTVVVGIGRLPVEVAREVVRGDHDLVMIAAETTVESAAAVRRILRSCPCPVWLIHQPLGGERVLAAIDPEDDPRVSSLILELARSQAEQRGAELHVVHGWQLFGGSISIGSEIDLVFGKGKRSSAELRDVLDAETAIEEAHDRAFTETLRSSNIDRSPNAHFVEGPPARAIRGLVDLYHIDLLVMGVIGRSAMDGVAVGDTAEQVLDRIGCSVLMVKPPGFVSPVQKALDG